MKPFLLFSRALATWPPKKFSPSGLHFHPTSCGVIRHQCRKYVYYYFLMSEVLKNRNFKKFHGPASDFVFANSVIGLFKGPGHELAGEFNLNSFKVSGGPTQPQSTQKIRFEVKWVELSLYSCEASTENADWYETLKIVSIITSWNILSGLSKLIPGCIYLRKIALRKMWFLVLNTGQWIEAIKLSHNQFFIRYNSVIIQLQKYDPCQKYNKQKNG